MCVPNGGAHGLTRCGGHSVDAGYTMCHEFIIPFMCVVCQGVVIIDVLHLVPKKNTAIVCAIV